MQDMIEEGLGAKRRYLKSKEKAENSDRAVLYFDDETLGGLVTFDK